MKKIILASSSIRRRQLLSQIGLEFEVIKPEIDEKLNPRLKPRGNAEQLSLRKAQTVSEILKSADNSRKELNRKKDDKEGFVIIAADTFVIIDGEIIGKPSDKKAAKKILLRLNGNIHQVITGFTILNSENKKSVTKSVITKVYFRKLSIREIDAYLKTGEPMDKAGAYAMQGRAAVFIEKIEGDPFNVIGLPLAALYAELKKFGIETI